jgi:hypothetical protein
MSAVARRYYVRGKAALDKGDLDGALEALRAAIDLVPGFCGARVAYAVALARYGDTPRAAQARGRPSDPSSGRRGCVWATLGDVLTIIGDFLGAEDAFRTEQHPRSPAGLPRAGGPMQLGHYADSFAHLAALPR